MRRNQLNRGETRRLMYVENKDGTLDGREGRIGWVTFSKTGKTVYYRNRTLHKSKGQGIRGNFFDENTGEEYWVSGVKIRGSNAHWAEHTGIKVDDDAVEEYNRIRNGASV